jgi:hypothetical protein
MHHVFSLLLLISSPLAAADLASSRGFLEAHCFECHDSDVQKGGLDLTALKEDLTKPLNFLDWARVHDRVKSGEMPPPKKPRPQGGALDSWAVYDLSWCKRTRGGRRRKDARSCGG